MRPIIPRICLSVPMALESLVMPSRAGQPAGSAARAVLKSLMLAAVCGSAFLPAVSAPANPAATQPATAIDPKTAEPGYWYDLPGVVTVNTPEFDTLWKACKLAARDDGFVLDRPGYRDGVMTTQPLTSKQFFEPWLNDVVDGAFAGTKLPLDHAPHNSV